MSEYVIIIPSYKGSNVENCAYEMSKTSLVIVSTMNRGVLSFISCERYSFVCVCVWFCSGLYFSVSTYLLFAHYFAHTACTLTHPYLCRFCVLCTCILVYWKFPYRCMFCTCICLFSLEVNICSVFVTGPTTRISVCQMCKYKTCVFSE